MQKISPSLDRRLVKQNLGSNSQCISSMKYTSKSTINKLKLSSPQRNQTIKKLHKKTEKLCFQINGLHDKINSLTTMIAREFNTLYETCKEVDRLFTYIQEDIDRGKYPNFIHVHEYTQLIVVLKMTNTINYNPINTLLKDNFTILAKLLKMEIDLFMSNEQMTINQICIDHLLSAGAQINDIEKQSLKMHFTKYFEHNQLISDYELKKLKHVFLILNRCHRGKYAIDEVEFNEFVSQYIKPIESNISNSTLPTTSKEIQIIHGPDLQELYNLETLNYIMDLYETDPTNKILRLSHITLAISEAKRKGLDNPSKRKKLLFKIRQQFNTKLTNE